MREKESGIKGSKKTFSRICLKTVIALIGVFLLYGCMESGEPARNIQLPVLFSDHMVLRQQFKNPVWGKAEPGGVVSVEINGQQKKAVADDAGDWQISLDPIPAGGPLTLHVFGADTLVISDVMIGEVWLCSGQSNMEMPLAGWGKVLNFEEEIATADYPDLRLFQVEKTMSDLPATKINCAGWSRCTPQTIPEFSSTAYFFGRMLQQQLNIPVGLIHSSWGGDTGGGLDQRRVIKRNARFCPGRS